MLPYDFIFELVDKDNKTVTTNHEYKAHVLIASEESNNKPILIGNMSETMKPGQVSVMLHEPTIIAKAETDNEIIAQFTLTNDKNEEVSYSYLLLI